MNYYTSKSFFIIILQTDKKNARKEWKKLWKYENSTIKLVLKSCKTFAEIDFINLIFPNFGTSFMFPQVKTQYSPNQKNFLVTETNLTLAWLWKTGIPKKWLTLLNSAALRYTKYWGNIGLGVRLQKSPKNWPVSS